NILLDIVLPICSWIRFHSMPARLPATHFGPDYLYLLIPEKALLRGWQSAFCARSGFPNSSRNRVANTKIWRSSLRVIRFDWPPSRINLPAIGILIRFSTPRALPGISSPPSRQCATRCNVDLHPHLSLLSQVHSALARVRLQRR